MSSTPLPHIITVFNDVLWSFHHIVLPICFILGNIGNCLNLLLFSQRASRANSCLLYFLSASVINIFILNVGLVLRILRGIWNIDPALKFVWFCRWRTFFSTACFLIYRYSILFACIDRACASSRNARIRMFSRPKVAYLLVVVIWIFFCIYLSPSWIFTTIMFGQCLAPPGSTFATYQTVGGLFHAVLIPSTMIISGIVIIRHLKVRNTHVAPLNPATADERKVAGQFFMMLVIQVVADFICNLLFPCYLVATLINPTLPTLQNGAFGFFMVNLSLNIPYLNYSAGFYLHTLSSSSFRQKFLHLLRQYICFQRFLARHQPGQNTQTIPMMVIRVGNTTAVNRITTQV